MRNSRSAWVFTAVALVLGGGIAFCDLHSKEVQGSVLLLLIVCGLLGWAQPARPWRWALLVGVWLPVSEFIAQAVRYPTAYPLNPPTSVIALIPSFIGAYLGALAAKGTALLRG